MVKMSHSKKKIISPSFIPQILNKNWETKEQNELEKLVKDVDNKNTTQKDSR
ncbi:hypothetical protein [Enterococcus sp. LJL90]